MTKENDVAQSYRRSGDAGPTVSHGRRRLLKGSAMSAPVLLTLRSVSVAANSSVLHGYLPPAGVGGALSSDPEFIRINRPTYRFYDEGGKPLEVVNAGLNDTCDSTRWFRVIRDGSGNVTSIPNAPLSYSGSCMGGVPGVGAVVNFEGTDYEMNSASLGASLVVGIDPTTVGGTGQMTVTSVGPTSQNVMLASVSSWTSLGVTSLDFNNWPST